MLFFNDVQGEEMEKVKTFLMKHFEEILVLLVLGGIIVISFLVPYKLAFLNYFYLPIIIAGYYLGKRTAVLTAVFCITVVIFLAVIKPSTFFVAEMGQSYFLVSLLGWGSFLILTSAALGYLYEEKEKRIQDLKAAYVGILEIMSKYLESADRYTKGHSVRVARLAQDIAIAMDLPRATVENIKAAALLHDIGKTEVSMDILNKAASLTTDEKQRMDSHTEKGAQLLGLVGGVLKEAVPIVLAHHTYYFEAKKFTYDSDGGENELPIGAAIIAVADAYDAIVTDRPYRAGKPPWKALEEIEKEAGNQFHPDVVQAFKRVLETDENYRLEKSPISFESVS